MNSHSNKPISNPLESFGSQFYELTPRTWSEAKDIGNNLKLHSFRGQSDSSWTLTTKLERVANRFALPEESLWEREKYILDIFKSRAHHFLNSPPKDDDIFEWLSIIQDYGGPTRLLDFTESFYIASFYALEDAINNASVWAVHNIGLKLMPQIITVTGIEKVGLKDEAGYIDEYNNNQNILRYAQAFVTDPLKKYDLVLRVIPPRLNERLAIQKGLFLFPCNLQKSFEGNLCETFGFPFNSLSSENAIFTDLPNDSLADTEKLDVRIKVAVVKINLTKQLHKEAIEDLYSMNIDAASLFPGIDGFARSLNNKVRFMPRSVPLSVSTESKPTSNSNDNKSPNG